MSSGRLVCFRSEWMSVFRSRALASPEPMNTRTGVEDMQYSGGRGSWRVVVDEPCVLGGAIGTAAQPVPESFRGLASSRTIGQRRWIRRALNSGRRRHTEAGRVAPLGVEQVVQNSLAF